MSEIKVFSHKIPDTDAVVSSIVYAWYLSEVEKKPAKAYILDAPNKETKYVLEQFGFDVPPILKSLSDGDQVVLVDTNNPDELIEDIHRARIIEIIDHHKLVGGISTSHPMSITMRPMASTASLIYTLINPELHEISKEIAGLMLSAIISDTLEFRSPTTTAEDKEIASELAVIADIDIHDLATKMFSAKSDISDIEAKDIIVSDSKVFNIHGEQIRVSVFETANPKQIMDMKDDIKKAMVEHVEESDLDDMLFFVVDILNEEATLIVASDNARSLAEKSFEKKVEEDGTLILPGIVSRKKQIIPKLQG